MNREPNPYFETARNWKEARKMVNFEPVAPAHTAGFKLQALRVHVRDHKKRELALGDRSLEAHYGGFSFSQERKGEQEAKRWALEVSYGAHPRPLLVGRCAGRVYELGPEPPPDDIDGRSPALVTWQDGEMVYLIASDTLESRTLEKVAQSVYRGVRRSGPGSRGPSR